MEGKFADSIIIKAGHGIMTIPRKTESIDNDLASQTEEKPADKSAPFTDTTNEPKS